MNRSQEKRREALIEQQILGALSESEALELAALNTEVDAGIAGTLKPSEEDEVRIEQLRELWDNVRTALKARDKGTPFMREVAVGREQFVGVTTLAQVALRCPEDLAARIDHEREVVIFDWSTA